MRGVQQIVGWGWLLAQAWRHDQPVQLTLLPPANIQLPPAGALSRHVTYKGRDRGSVVRIDAQVIQQVLHLVLVHNLICSTARAQHRLVQLQSGCARAQQARRLQHS